MDFIQVDIIGLSTSPSSGGAYALVLGEVGGNRRLPIIIGAFEAQAIALELEKIQPPRPMTHDLLRSLFDTLGAEVTDVVIDDLREGTFFAKVRYVHEEQEATLDARPSDAVALAVRTDAPAVRLVDGPRRGRHPQPTTPRSRTTAARRPSSASRSRPPPGSTGWRATSRRPSRPRTTRPPRGSATRSTG